MRPVHEERAPDRPKNRSADTVRNKRDAGKPAPVIPAGPLHIIVSVDAQRATLYANGQFVASTKVSTGTKSHPTPMGVFSVIQKNRHHVSNLYDAPMPYMQRLTWSGTAMHTGPLPGYPASHGCIRLENDFAQLLWKATKIGARVIVTRDEVKPIEFSHARLIAPKPPAPPQAANEKPLGATGALVRTANASDAAANTAVSDAQQSAEAPDPKLRIIAPAPIITDRAAATDIGKTAVPPTGPVSIFISRKEGRLYVRQAMQPLFDVPMTLRDPHEPLGTHVFTAMEMKNGAMRWTAVSMPSAVRQDVQKIDSKAKKKHVDDAKKSVSTALLNPGAALDRIDLPADVHDRLAELIIPGSSLIVSDNPLSNETGKSTDFIVLTR